MVKQRETWRVTIPEPYKTRLENNQCPNCGLPNEKWTRRKDWMCCSKKCSDEYYGGPGMLGRVIHSWPELRKAALKRDNYKCVKCRKCPTEEIVLHNKETLDYVIENDGQYISHKEKQGCFIVTQENHSKLIGDHIVPIALGGEEFDINNVQTLCSDCNKVKTREDIKKIAKQRAIEKKLKNNQKQLTEENKMEIKELKLKDIKERETNPNQMNKTQLSALKASVEKYGQLRPLVIDQENNLVDGHQLKKVLEETGKDTASVLKLDLKNKSDVSLLSQILNKVRGKHDEDLDAAEFKRILEDSDMETLSSLTSISEQEILNILNKADEESKEVLKKEMDIEQKRTIQCPHCKTDFEIDTKGR